MINNLSPKRDFTPANPNLEEDIKTFLKTPIKLEKPSLPSSQKKYKYHYSISSEVGRSSAFRRSAPSNLYTQKSSGKTAHSSMSWNPPEIEDDISYSSGVRRAFDQKHKKYSEVALRQNEQRWEDEEKYRRWKLKKDHQYTEMKNRKHDRHVIENVIQSRNDYYVSSMNNYRPPIKVKVKTSGIRAAPIEIRSVGRNRTYYWA